MTDKRIVYTNPETGVVAIVIPAPGVKIEDVIAKLPKDLAYEVVDASEIPTDRTFRDAWEHDITASLKKVATNITKAKAIAHDKRRAKREELFTPLDKEATVPALAQTAENKRVIIRDADDKVQKALDKATTEEALKAELIAYDAI